MRIYKNKTTSSSLSFWQKLVYSCGDFSLGGTFNVINIFYPIFLASIVKLPSYYTAIVFLVARIYDAVSDLYMGFITDKTKTRFGRRKPYIIGGTFFLLISFIILFFPYKMESDLLKFFVVLLTYIFFYTIQTVISTSYYALAGELSDDYNERTKLLSLRLLFSLSASGICTLLPGFILKNYTYIEIELVNNIPTEVSKYTAEGYQVLALVFGIMFTVFLLITGFFVKENKNVKCVAKEEKLLKNIFTPLRIKTARKYYVLQVLKCVCMAVMSSVAPFYATYYLQKPDLLYYILGLVFAAQIFALPLWQFVCKKTSKSFTFIVSSICWIVAGLLFLIIDESTPLYALLILSFFLGFSLCGVILMPNAMFADVTDIGELLYDDRREGIFAGFESIVYKIASALATAGIMLILGFFGFDKTPYGNDSRLAIRLMLCLSPLIVLSFGILVASTYKLDSKTHSRLQSFIKERKKENHTPKELAELENEKKSLEKELV